MKKSMISAVVGFFCLSSTAPAVITVEGGSGAVLSISFSSPPAFTLSSPINHDNNGHQLYLVISGIMSPSEDNFSGSPPVSNIAWTNDGSGGGDSIDNSVTVSVTTYNVPLNDIAASDLWIWLDTSGQSEPGDVITFSSFSFTSGAAFSSVIPDGITANVFLTDESGNLASNVLEESISVIPEPSAAAVLFLGVLPLLRRRRMLA